MSRRPYNVRKRSKAKIDYLGNHIVIVARSNKNVTAQVLFEGKTIFTSVSNKMTGTKTEKATQVGKAVADYLKTNKVESVIFDRNGFVYTGRVAIVAEQIREAGILA